MHFSVLHIYGMYVHAVCLWTESLSVPHGALNDMSPLQR